jgi:hypothetical protein
MENKKVNDPSFISNISTLQYSNTPFSFELANLNTEYNGVN